MQQTTGATSLLDYFQTYFRSGRVAEKLVFASYFVVMLIVPLYRVTSTSEKFVGDGTVVMVLVLVVQSLFVLGIYRFNRSSAEVYRSIGRKTLYLVALPVMLIGVSLFITLVLHDDVPTWFVHLMISVSIAIPLLLVILILAESIFQIRPDKGLLLPFMLILVTDFLIIYIFGAIYFINELVVNAKGSPGSFADSLYVSGQAFTTLGFSTAQPTGIGQLLVLFEALTGFLILSLLTALFLQTIFSRRQSSAR